MTTVSFHTLGCKMNQAETEALKETALSSGLNIIDFGSPCDICVINTCTVTAIADKKSRQAIRKAVRLSKGNVYVTGCLAKVDKKEIEDIHPGLHIFKINDFTSSLGSSSQGPGTSKNVLLDPGRWTLDPIRLRSNLIIQNGCDNFCSYCIVPYARGREKDRSYDEIVSEAKEKAKSGIKEVILTGINTGAFKRLPELLVELLQINGLLRIRLSSIEPLNITDRLIDVVANNKRICRHLHIPLQSGDNEILKKMNRKYSITDYEKVIASLRRNISDIAISTDIIVGFPGETEEQFQNTMDFIKKIGFTRLHVFRFSKRKGTPAAEMKDQINTKTIIKRSKLMQKLRGELMLEYHKSLIGTKQEVLIEQRDKKSGMLEGLTDTYVRVFTKGPDEFIGKIIMAEIGKAQIESTAALSPPPARYPGY